jgi:PAS domain S-box-containing protein
MVDTGQDVTEAQIMEVLDKTGKASPENQLNCGACGYASCRDKAIAVVQGMAEPEMCIPYMKRLAEARTDKILVNSPNGIVILDEHLNILSMNQAFRDFFMCSEAICGKPISYLMDPDPFERLATGDDDRLEVTVKHDRYGIVSREMLYKLPQEKQYVGIFIDITKMKADKEQLDSLRVQTATQAKELLEHQISMAQTLAKYLGENTARSEQLLEKLMTLSDEDSQGPEDGRKSIWDTYTSK